MILRVYFRNFSLLSILVLVSLFFWTSICTATAPAAGQLLEIPHPNLDGLEDVVVGQIESGKADLEMIANNPEADNKLKALTYGNLGHLYHTYDFLDAAEACYQNAAQLQEDVYRWNYCVAFVAQKKGALEKALEFYKRARTIDVTTNLIYLVNIRIGECYHGLNDLENAMNAFTISYTLNPKGPAVLARMGELSLAQHKYQKAVDYLGLALTQEPAANKLHYPLAMAYRKLGKKELAEHHLKLRGIVGVQPPDPLKNKLDSLLRGFRIHTLEGKMAYSAKRYEDAVLSFSKAVAEDPGKASGWVNLGVTNAQLGKHQEALENFTEALKRDPLNMTAHFDIGDLFLRLGRDKEAISHLQTFVDSNPDDALANAQLARAYRNDTMVKESIEHYQKSLNLDHSQVNVWLELIDLFERLGAYTTAIGITELGLKKLPKEKSLLAKLAHALATSPQGHARDGKKALEVAETLFQSESNYLTARLVALAYAELNRCGIATEWMDKAIVMAKESSADGETLNLLTRNKDFISSSRPCTVTYDDEKQ